MVVQIPDFQHPESACLKKEVHCPAMMQRRRNQSPVRLVHPIIVGKKLSFHLLVATFWTRSFGNTGDRFYLPGETVPTLPGAMKFVLKNSKLNAEFDSAGPAETQCENQ
jgi:hypothetical protein